MYDLRLFVGQIVYQSIKVTNGSRPVPSKNNIRVRIIRVSGEADNNPSSSEPAIYIVGFHHSQEETFLFKATMNQISEHVLRILV